MKSRFLVIIALSGLFGSSVAFAQNGFGKKSSGSNQSRSSSGGRSSSQTNRGNMGGGSNTRSNPPSRGSGSNSGFQPNYRSQPPSRDNGAGTLGGYHTNPTTRGNDNGFRTTPPVRGGSGNSGGYSGGGTGGYRSQPPSRTTGPGSGSHGTNLYTPPQDALGKKGGGNKGGGGSGGGSGGSSGSGSTGGVRVDPGPGRGGSGGSGGGHVGGGGSVDLGKVIGGGRSNGGTGSGRTGGDVPLGRPDRGTSRSGSVGYGGNHNLGRGGGKGISIGEIPVVGTNRKIEREVNRENRVHVGDTRYRNGYWNNNRGWCDDNFYYPYYGFQYYDGCNYVPSPFYFYYHLPAYVSCTRINLGFISWTNCNTLYAWNRPSYDRYMSDYDRRADFDYAVDNVERSFESGNMRHLSMLIPSSGRIEIDVDGQDQYSIGADDFYDMMRDLVEGTKTLSYRIEHVYRDGDRGSIEAVHEYEDAWGRTQCVYHTFGLKRGRRGYEVCYFKSWQR